MPARATFDPRQAALVHAGMAERAASGHRGSSALVTAELAHSVACGLVYVGDQIRQLGDEPALTFAEMMPSIREQAIESLRTVHGVEASYSAERLVDAVLRMAEMIVNSNGGARRGER